MEIELAVLTPQARAELQPKVRKYRSDFDAIKRQLMKLLERFNQKRDRETLMGAQVEDVRFAVNIYLVASKS